MRYKFRGKRLDGQGWVRGYYWYDHHTDKHFITVTEWNSSGWNLQIIPESVGQWTGLVDRHGKEIYEGDILHRDWYQDMFVEFYKGAFCLVSCNPVQRANWSPVTCRGSDIIYREIIGNIHDNPELMEVE